QFAPGGNALYEIFPEMYELKNIQTDMAVDFRAVKVGDVNGSALAGAAGEKVAPRTSRNVVLTTPNKSFTRGEEIEVTLSTEEAQALLGMQYTLNFNQHTLELLEVKGETEGSTMDNFGLARVNEGMINASWNAGNGSEISDVVTLKFK